MDRLRRDAILVRLIDYLREKGSWCGETHVQKAVYMLQELLGVRLGFEFVLYRYGPFSFDLRDELGAMRSEGLLKLEPQLPYGPRLATDQSGSALVIQLPQTVEKVDPHLQFVAETIGSKDVSELERLLTALYVERVFGGTAEERAKRITELKPHVVLDKARRAVEVMEQIGQQARPIILS